MAGEDSSEKGLKYTGEHGLSYKSSETSQVPIPKFSRRRFLGIGAVAAIAVAAKKLGLIDKGMQAVKDSVDTGDPNWGKPIDGEDKRPLITSLFGDNNAVILRSGVTQGDKNIIGYTLPGINVEAQPVLGTVYSEGSDYLTNIQRDGKDYGKWYLIEDVPVYQKISGRLIPKLDEQGQQVRTKGYVSGNYLRMPGPDETVPSGK